MTKTFTAEILDFHGDVYLRITVKARDLRMALSLARGRMLRMLGDGYRIGNVAEAA
jgi:hypothetical protein